MLFYVPACLTFRAACRKFSSSLIFCIMLTAAEQAIIRTMVTGLYNMDIDLGLCKVSLIFSRKYFLFVVVLQIFVCGIPVDVNSLL